MTSHGPRFSRLSMNFQRLVNHKIIDFRPQCVGEQNTREKRHGEGNSRYRGRRHGSESELDGELRQNFMTQFEVMVRGGNGLWRIISDP